VSVSVRFFATRRITTSARHLPMRRVCHAVELCKTAEWLEVQIGVGGGF